MKRASLLLLVLVGACVEPDARSGDDAGTPSPPAPIFARTQPARDANAPPIVYPHALTAPLYHSGREAVEDALRRRNIAHGLWDAADHPGPDAGRSRDNEGKAAP